MKPPHSEGNGHNVKFTGYYVATKNNKRVTNIRNPLILLVAHL